MEASQVDIVAIEASMQTELKTLRDKTNEAKKFTIFRTPDNISQGKKNLFEPTVVSIGPFHCGKEHLRAKEEQKWRFLQNFLARGDHISLDLCISEMKLLEETTRSCYSVTFNDIDSTSFVEMMLLDGCFVLEYFLKLFEGKLNYSRLIYRDLLLLENQIPFFIVKKLFEIIPDPPAEMDFVKYIASTLLPRPTEDFIDSNIIPDPPAEIHHLVHLSYHYLVPNPSATEKPVASPNSTSPEFSMMIRSATELEQWWGLKFRPKRAAKHMLDISFEYGVLKIPRLAITDSTESIFANLIAFEQSSYVELNLPFTNFVTFLDNLVNTPNDVRILLEGGIVQNLSGGSVEELTRFINQVGEGNFIETDHYLAELYMKVNTYLYSSHRRKARWINRQREKLIREYFSSPWAAISVFAALILLVLTCVQTFYAVYAYKFPPSS